MSVENLEELVNRTVYILREAKAQFKKPCVLWSTGKDSTAMLSLCRDAFFGTVPFPVVHIDTLKKFKVMYQFRERLVKEWGLDLIVAKSPRAEKFSPLNGTDHLECCQALKTDVLRAIIEEHGFDAVIVSIRRDEHYMRNYERVMSPRDKMMRWKLVREKEKGEAGDAPFVSLQDLELWDFVVKDFGKDVHHVRVHPLLHWDEFDVWHYTKQRKLPVNPLYFSRDGYRYRSLGCEPCTTPVRSDASSIEEILEELKTTKIPERSGRAQDKEAEQVMRKLRSMGYL